MRLSTIQFVSSFAFKNLSLHEWRKKKSAERALTRTKFRQQRTQQTKKYHRLLRRLICEYRTSVLRRQPCLTLLGTKYQIGVFQIIENQMIIKICQRLSLTQVRPE